jgi:hypothetical protein
MDEKKWARAWSFLSLNTTLGFFEDLWVPVNNPDEFQSSLRRRLSSWVNQGDYLEKAGAVNYLLCDWFLLEHGQTSLDELALWVSEIFLVEGPDRAGRNSLEPFPL